jgi:hypothetical protein
VWLKTKSATYSHCSTGPRPGRPLRWRRRAVTPSAMFLSRSSAHRQSRSGLVARLTVRVGSSPKFRCGSQSRPTARSLFEKFSRTREGAAESDHHTDATQSSHPPARQPAARAVTQSARATHHHQRRCACGRAQLSKGVVCCDAPFCGNTGSTSFGQCTCVWQLPNAPEIPKNGVPVPCERTFFAVSSGKATQNGSKKFGSRPFQRPITEAGRARRSFTTVFRLF